MGVPFVPAMWKVFAMRCWISAEIAQRGRSVADAPAKSSAKPMIVRYHALDFVPCSSVPPKSHRRLGAGCVLRNLLMQFLMRLNGPKPRDNQDRVTNPRSFRA